jgi:hypothetical protein
MGKNPDPGSGMNISDLIYENFVKFLWVEINLNSLMRIRDFVNPGSGTAQVGSGFLDPG